MTGAERVQSHMDKFGARAAASEIVKDYAEGAVLEMGGVNHEGKAAIEAFFISNYNMLGEQQFSDVKFTENEDGTVEIDWKLGPMTGGDKFWFDDDGYFLRQRVFIGSKPEDW